MSITLPAFRVGEPLRRESLTLFPLYTEEAGEVEYLLSDEAIAQEMLLVEEVNESGSVPELTVENKSDSQVLFLEGEELIGAKQNRILNTSVLVGAHSKIKIPVSCVEQGRWSYHSRHFGSSGSHSPSKLRHKLKETVSRSVRESHSHRSDQGEVWNEVSCLSSDMKVSSATMAMSDAFIAHEESINEIRESMQYPEGASGIAVAIGEKVVSVDLFDKPVTCQKVWNRLLSGAMMEALRRRDREAKTEADQVEKVLRESLQMQWEPAPPLGVGEEQRASGESGEQASALLYEGRLVHGSVLLSQD